MKVIAVCFLFRLYDVFSLKDKRSIRKSLIDRLKNKFNISVSETGHMDDINLLEISFCAVSNDYTQLEKVHSSVMNFIESQFMLELVSEEKEFF